MSSQKANQTVSLKKSFELLIRNIFFAVFTLLHSNWTDPSLTKHAKPKTLSKVVDFVTKLQATHSTYYKVHLFDKLQK